MSQVPYNNKYNIQKYCTYIHSRLFILIKKPCKEVNGFTPVQAQCRIKNSQKPWYTAEKFIGKSVMVAQQKELFVVMKHKVVARMKSVALTMRSSSYVIKVSELNLFLSSLYADIHACSNFDVAETKQWQVREIGLMSFSTLYRRFLLWEQADCI